MSNPFEAMAKKRAEDKAEKEAKKDNPFLYEDRDKIEYVSCITDTPIVGRFIGRDAANRLDDHDAIFVLWSKIVNDTKKGYVHINWKPVYDDEGRPTLEPDPDWILMEMYQAITEGEWEGEYGTDNNKKIFTYADTAVCRRVEKNKTATDQYPQQFYPRSRVFFNWLDRMDNWCVANKHTKVLTSSKNKRKEPDKNGNPIWFIDPGVPSQGLYEKIMDEIWLRAKTMDIDIMVTKNKLTKDYTVSDTSGELVPDEIKAISRGSEPNTVEESAYEKYDLTNVRPVTSYNKIQKGLKQLARGIDDVCDTNFAPRLADLARVEKEQLNKEAKEKAKTQHPVESDVPMGVQTHDEDEPEDTGNFADDVAQDTMVSGQQSQPESQPTQQSSRRRRDEPAAEKSIEQMCIEIFPHWDKLDDSTKATKNNQGQSFKEAMISNVESFNGKVPIYKSSLPKNDLEPCQNEGCTFDGTIRTMLPLSVWLCPVCGIVLP
jgi:hypothetical protein